MSLSRHLLAIAFLVLPAVGCEVEDDDTKRPAEPAPAEPARPIPQPQVTPASHIERVVALGGTRPGDGPAFARPVG